MPDKITNSAIADRFQQIARAEERARRRGSEPINRTRSSDKKNASRRLQDAEYKQLVLAVELLQQYCDTLEGQSAYLGVYLYREKSAAEATLVVGRVDEQSFFEAHAPANRDGSPVEIKCSRTIRVGHLRDNYEKATGVAELVDTGQVFSKLDDLRAYLEGPLLQEIGAAVGECRTRYGDNPKDQPYSTEDLPFGLAYQRCRGLAQTLLGNLLHRMNGRELPVPKLAAAGKVVASLEIVTSKLAELSRLYELDVRGLGVFSDDDWPAVTTRANLAWVVPCLQFTWASYLLGILADSCTEYAKAEASEAQDFRAALEEKSAKAERAWERAAFDTALERRIERTLERLESSMEDHLANISTAEDVAAVLKECALAIESVSADAAVALSINPKDTNLPGAENSTHFRWIDG